MFAVKNCRGFEKKSAKCAKINARKKIMFYGNRYKIQKKARIS